MTKIDIVSGFLGAGKTTLIKKLIDETLKNENIVIIENEFGEIGIDSGFLSNAGIKVTEMNSGCICCSLVGDFAKALEKVIKEYSPDRIIIEPSGVGKLSDVITALNNIGSDELALNSFTTVVDAKKCKIYHKNFGEFFNNQIQSAKTIILSHTNDIAADKLIQCTDIISELNPNALIVTTDWDKLSGIQIITAMEKGCDDIAELMEERHHDEHCDCGCHHHEHHHHDEHCECNHNDHKEHEHHHDEHCNCGCHSGEHEHHHHADEIFISWGMQSAEKYTKNDIASMLDCLNESDKYGTILRAKGIVEEENGNWIHFDYIPGEADVRFGNADITGKICVIGTDLNKNELEKLFSKR